FKFRRVIFKSPVSPEQLKVEINTNFRHTSLAVLLRRSNLKSRYQIFLGICADLPYRKLRSSEDHRLIQALQHKAQGRSRKRHCVRAMKNYKTIIQSVIALYNFR